MLPVMAGRLQKEYSDIAWHLHNSFFAFENLMGEMSDNKISYEDELLQKEADLARVEKEWRSTPLPEITNGRKRH
jgi:hypothetical protein